MSTEIITLSDGLRVEAEVTETEVAHTEGQVERGIDQVQSLLVRAVQPVVAAWRELNQTMTIDTAEIELGFGFEASGSLFIASTKGNVNLKVTLTLKPGAPAPAS